MKKIVFQSQMGFIGQIPRTHNNMRVEFAQMCALQADHYPLLFDTSKVTKKYDIAVIPILNNITKAKITKIKNANLATKLFDSKKDGEPTFPLVVENDLNASLSLIIYK
jgi:hypothetical protein